MPAPEERCQRPMPTVDEKVDLNEVYRLLSAGNSGVVVLRRGQPVGVVTRIDLVNFWDDPFNQEFEPAEPAKAGAVGAKS